MAGLAKIISPVTVQDCNLETENLYLYQEIENSLTVNFLSTTDKNVSIQLYDISGKLIFQEKKSLMQGQNIIRLNLADLAKGVYIFSMHSNTWTKHQSFIKG